VVIDSPLRGPGWANLNGCCETSAHRYMRAAADGRVVKPETFAIDWMQVRDGLLYEGDGTGNDQYFGEGAPIHAVAGGTVVTVIDGKAETTPFATANLRTTEDYGGNTVVQRIRAGVYAYYAHFRPGSIRVQEGDRVRAGEVLGQLGSSGNSTNPHLHFGLQRGPGVLTSDSLPFEIRRYTVTGTVRDISFPNVEISTADLRQRRTLPLIGTVADFG
jgi:murein DD-endopeptidase MepM/ murein hydrolase activator NlpD